MAPTDESEKRHHDDEHASPEAAHSPPDPPEEEAPPPRPEVETTRINRGWLTKMVVIAVALLALGAWGLYDALFAFPNRGAAHAEYVEWQYLQTASEGGQLLTAGVDDPQDEYARLVGERSRLRDRMAQSSEGSLARREAATAMARLEWLTSLSRIGRLDPSNTTFDNPRARLDELREKWSTRNPPKPLAAYDIPSQWLFVVGGFGGAAWIALILLRASRVQYRYRPASMELTLPSGRTITPEQISEVDKRKWHKFYVTLRFKEDGASPLTLDLLRHKPLEDWILEMEKRTDGYEPPKEETGEESAMREGAGVAMGGEDISEEDPEKPSP